MIDKNYKQSLILMILALSILSLRIDNFYDFVFGASLWTEDGNIFLTQAFTLGVKSFWTPYAGYIHLYPRIFAYIASNFDLSFSPFILIAGWILAFSFMICIISKEYEKANLHWSWAFITVIAITLQPHSGETFFNITNAQWFLAITFATIVLLNERIVPSFKNFILLCLLSLTGPYSIIIIPLLVIKIFIKNDLRNNWFFYVLIFLCGMVQLYFMLHTNRLSGLTDLSIKHWLESFWIFLTFGTNSLMTIYGYSLINTLSIVFWICILTFTIVAIINKKFDQNTIKALFLLAAVFIFYFAGLYSNKASPNIINPLDNGSRYFIIPYSLSLILLPLLIKNKKFLYMLFILFFTISLFQFTHLYRINLYYQSYVWLSKQVDEINIPINPQWEMLPGWEIVKKSSFNSHSANVIVLQKQNIQIINGSLDGNKIHATTDDLQLHFTTPSKCKFSHHIGLEVELIREEKGWTKIYWAKNAGEFIEAHSHKRYYPVGEIKMQFALKNNQANYFRFDPTEKKENIQINKITIFCGENNESN